MEQNKTNTTKYVLFLLIGLLVGVGASLLIVLLIKGNSSNKKYSPQVTMSSSDKIEGDGFSTPEEAVETYLNTFSSGNMDALYQCYAVETSVINYTVDRQIERLQAYQPANPKLPIYGDLSYGINVEYKRSEISKSILNHYRILMRWVENIRSSTIALADYDSVDQLIDECMPNNEAGLSKGITIDKIYSDSDIILENWNSDAAITNRERITDTYNAEDIASVTAIFHTDQGYFAWFAGAIKYDGIWYLDSNPSILSMFYGIDQSCSGMIYIGNTYNPDMFSDTFK